MAVRRTDLLQGTLDLLILRSLTAGPNHGYGMAIRIHQFSDEVLKIEEGSLYPALYRLEEQGLIESEWRITENNRKAKFYKLTRKGRDGVAGRARQLAAAVESRSPACCAPSNKEPEPCRFAHLAPPPAASRSSPGTGAIARWIRRWRFTSSR